MGVITKKLQNKKYVGGANTTNVPKQLNQPKPSKFGKFKKFLSTMTNPFKKPPQIVRARPEIEVIKSTGTHLGKTPTSNNLSVNKQTKISPVYLIPGQQVTGNIYSTAPSNNNIAPSIPARSIKSTVSGNSLPRRPRRPNIYEIPPGNEIELPKLQPPPLNSVAEQKKKIAASKAVAAAAAAASKTNNNNAEPYATYVPKPGVFGTNTERLRDAYKLTFPGMYNTSTTNNGRKNTNTIRRGNIYLKLKNTLRRNNNNNRTV
jgi:hypothetical protein